MAWARQWPSILPVQERPSPLLRRFECVPIIALLGVGTGAVLWILSFLTQAGYGTLVVVSLLAGLCGIGWVGMVTVLRAELAPREGVGIVTSLGSFMGYAGSLLGPPLFGLLLDRTGDYRLAWRLLGLCAVLAGLLVLRARERTQPGANPIAEPLASR